MANLQPRGSSRRGRREVRDTRKPLYFIFILDTSSSMNEDMIISKGEGEVRRARRIDELNRGLADALNSLRSFEADNVRYKVYYQIIELNSYGKALFPTFIPLSVQSEEVCFEAEGVTCLENSINTLDTFLTPEHMVGCNRAANVLLISDGYPTDVDGYPISEARYKKIIGEFKQHLEDCGVRPNIDFYAIGVGANACVGMLKEFADQNKYYEVGDLESLKDKFNFVTRHSLVRRRVAPVPYTDTAVGTGSTVGTGVITASAEIREIDISKCINAQCLACVGSCALNAISYDEGIVIINNEACVGCGACESVCPEGAIHIADEVGCDGMIGS